MSTPTAPTRTPKQKRQSSSVKFGRASITVNWTADAISRLNPDQRSSLRQWFLATIFGETTGQFVGKLSAVPGFLTPGQLPTVPGLQLETEDAAPEAPPQ